MSENNPEIAARERFEADLVDFANRHSLNRVRTSSPNFELDYNRAEDGRLILTSEKAVIRALGKVSKVPIGEHEQYKTYAEAEAATTKYWSDYFKQRRAKRTEAERRGEARRQRLYRERRKAEKQRIEHNPN